MIYIKVFEELCGSTSKTAALCRGSKGTSLIIKRKQLSIMFYAQGYLALLDNCFFRRIPLQKHPTMPSFISKAEKQNKHDYP
jgi:hypothetical protein